MDGQYIPLDDMVNNNDLILLLTLKIMVVLAGSLVRGPIINSQMMRLEAREFNIYYSMM